MSESMPSLPEGQRWRVSHEFDFLVVKLQERRWWGWRTIATSTGLVTGGRHALNECIDHILRRDYYARLMAERDARECRARAEIPFGTHKADQP